MIKSFSQNTVDFLKGNIDISIDPNKKKVEGRVLYTFKVIENTERIAIDAKKMRISQVLLEEQPVDFEYKEDKVVVSHSFRSNQNYKIAITYTTSPNKAMYFVKDQTGSHQVWTQGQGKYSSNWVPSFDDMNEKVEFDFTITAPKSYTIIANGQLVQKEVVKDQKLKWIFDMEKPMSSYLLALVVGTYNQLQLTSQSGTPISLYYHPADSTKVEPTYRHSVEIFDFLEKEIGYAYPWQNYKQIPVKDFLYAGMENTGTTIFSDAFVVDSIAFADRNYVNVNAHELAHQWFGNLVTETDGKHHWLQEGFATYYALLAEKKIFGEDYFLFKLYESAEQLTTQSRKENNTSLLDPKANSLTFYQRGAWALYALHQLIGDKNFKITIHNYLEKYQFKNVTTSDFIKVAQEVSGTDLTEYRRVWLEEKPFPSEKALKLLTKHDFIKQYLTLAQQRTQPLAGKWELLKKTLKFPVNDFMGQEVVYQLNEDTSAEAVALLDQAFESNNTYVRQAIATSITKIPNELQKQYEKLLKDPSYATIEAALYHLWIQYPSKRKLYLDQTKDFIGFTDNNIRLLWLVLAVSTSDYNTDRHQQYFQELSNYTSPKYSFSTRQNAFSYLQSLQSFSKPALENLAEGTAHHHWRFRKFCRQLLDELLKDSSYKKKYVDLLPNLSIADQTYLQLKLSE
ncbi:M1 family metallopeptidase [Aquimarina sp. ERC-38]|uniref:M1 family metallopeptidase n=1 Tax=Aquimarina sp. ERC-38 TaxID=2949996 RepID=UPI0022482AF3|nr:M1 family metallopeptidase [Aquimarina sp. ERC-38]UZO79891.1 M1 family metallopeptidase [Aquimarina sp. ERC-38]